VNRGSDYKDAFAKITFFQPCRRGTSASLPAPGSRMLGYHSINIVFNRATCTIEREGASLAPSRIYHPRLAKSSKIAFAVSSLDLYLRPRMPCSFPVSSLRLTTRCTSGKPLGIVCFGRSTCAVLAASTRSGVVSGYFQHYQYLTHASLAKRPCRWKRSDARHLQQVFLGQEHERPRDP
jgi:hypothetical protein